MNEKSPCKIDSEKSANQPTETNENNKNSGDAEIPKDSWAEDQQEKSYYYDDSYGYEIYNPDEDDEEE